MSSKIPKVSIIIPVYNPGALATRCMESLYRQTLDDIEYIVIDDGSTDESLSLIRKAMSDFPERAAQTRLIVHEQNRGLAYTRAEGYSLATGEYVIGCDSDDRVDTDYYESLYTTAKKEHADIVAGNLVVDDGDRHTEHPFPLFDSWEHFLAVDHWLMFSLCRQMLRREFLEENEIRFDPAINYAEDDYFLFRCYRYSRKNAVCMDTYYHYCKDNSDSMTCNRFRISHLLDKARCLEQLSAFVDDNGGDARACVILNQEKRAVKEGFYLSATPDYNLWRSKFPEITPIVIRDPKLSLLYRMAWATGQYIHPSIFKYFIKWHSR